MGGGGVKRRGSSFQRDKTKTNGVAWDVGLTSVERAQREYSARANPLVHYLVAARKDPDGRRYIRHLVSW